MADVIIASAQSMSFDKVCKAVSRICKAVAPPARQHDEWVLSFDFEKNAALVTVRADDVDDEHNQDVGRVHSWMVGVERAVPIKNSQGSNPQIGGGEFEWMLTLSVWGFFDVDLIRVEDNISSQAFAMKEAELVAASIFANTNLALDAVEAIGLREVQALEFNSIDNHAFSDGHDVIVAQGSMQVRIDRII
jgi:hypothetical protein